jgi:hypothetical protein
VEQYNMTPKFSKVNYKKFSDIYLKEFRHVSQQMVDILNIFYNDEYNQAAL